MRPEDFIIVFVTVSNEDEALKIARYVVEHRLAACTNIVHGIRSIYRWKEEICDDRELLCIMKTKKTLFKTLRDAIKQIHSYEVAEIIATPLVEGAEDYLRWLDRETI